MAKSSELWPVPNTVLTRGSLTSSIGEITKTFTVASSAVISQNITENTWFMNYWTTGSPQISTAVQWCAGAGTYAASLMFGGLTSGPAVSSQTIKVTTGTTGTLNTARQQLGGTGLQNAALSFGGDTAAGGGSFSAVTEVFTGTSWTNIPTPALTARATIAGSGIQGATAAFGGKNGSVVLATTELFNGGTWAASGSMTTARGALIGTGTQGAGLAIGGLNFAGSEQTAVESFNGSTWTTLTSLVTAQGASSGAGTLNATTIFGGTRGGSLGVETCLTYNGTTWSVIAPMLFARKNLAGTGCAAQAWALGGYGNNYGTLQVSDAGEYYRGRVSAVAYSLASLTNLGLYVVPSTSSSISLAKETLGISEVDSFNWYTSANELGYLTTLGRNESCDKYGLLNLGVWSIGASLPQSVYQNTGLGTQSTMLSICGLVQNGNSLTAYIYGYRNGIWYTSLTSNTFRGGAGAGLAQAGIYFGGTQSAPSQTNISGSSNVYKIIADAFASISPSSSLPVQYYAQAGCGHAFAAMSVGGQIRATSYTYYHDTYLFNGYAWSTGGDMSAVKGELGLVGTPSAAIVFAGYGGSYTNVSEKFNGSTWASDNNYPQTTSAVSSSGTSVNTATGHGGYVGGNGTVYCYKYNGSSWSAMTSLNTASEYQAAASLTGFPMVVGGYNPGTASYHALSQIYGLRFPLSNILPSTVTSTVPMLNC